MTALELPVELAATTLSPTPASVLHGALLIHDDLIDGDLLRLGRPGAVRVQLLDLVEEAVHVSAAGYLAAGQQQAAVCGLPSELTDWLARECGSLRDAA